MQNDETEDLNTAECGEALRKWISKSKDRIPGLD